MAPPDSPHARPRGRPLRARVCEPGRGLGLSLPRSDPLTAPPAALRGSLAGRQGCGGKSIPHTPARGFLVRAGSRVRFARASVRRGGGALPRRAGGAAPDLSTFRADHRPAQSRGNSLPWCWVGDKRSASDRRAGGESAGGEGGGWPTSHILPCLSLVSTVPGVHSACTWMHFACHSSDAGAHRKRSLHKCALALLGWGAASLQKLEGALSCFSETRGARSRANGEVRTYGLASQTQRADLWSVKQGRTYTSLRNVCASPCGRGQEAGLSPLGARR